MGNMNKGRTIFSAKTFFGRGLRRETRIFKDTLPKSGSSTFTLAPPARAGVSAHPRPILQFRKMPESFVWHLFDLSIRPPASFPFGFDKHCVGLSSPDEYEILGFVHANIFVFVTVRK
jgi:hypothetical protein